VDGIVTDRDMGGGDPDVAALLAARRADGCEFGHTLANHLPMVLMALQAMGASPRRLAAFAAHYRTKNALGPAPPAQAPITPSDWTETLGDRGRETDYRRFFAAELERLGAAEVQRRYLPTLLPGVAASATHALMRLAYANRFGVAAEIATSLGYWAATFLPLRSPATQPAQADTDDPVRVLERLQAHPHLLRIEPPTDLLWHAMRAVAADPVFTAELDRFRADPATLRAVAAASLALFADTMDFCALHALTGSHWIRLLPDGVADRGAVLRAFWRSIAALYPKIGMPKLPTAEALAELRGKPCPPWPEIMAAAVASDDEHDHSLVFSAWEEAAFWGDDLYRVVAARRVGLA
jgi:hypothetical protein